MIPGPVEFEDSVLEAMSTPATSHVDPEFIKKFSGTLKGLRTVFCSPVMLSYLLV